MLQNNLKFDIDDIVYFIGEGKIQEAKVCEVRYVKRYDKTNSGNCVNFNTYKISEFEVYRLYKTSKLGDTINIDAVHIYYDGEYCETTWFTADDLFGSVEEAIEYLKSNVETLEK